MSAWGDFSTSDTLFGVGRSDACAVGRSGESLEAPCGRTISLAALPFASIDTKAAWSNGRSWRWAYFRDASRSARVSPCVLPGTSTYPSYTNLRLMLLLLRLMRALLSLVPRLILLLSRLPLIRRGDLYRRACRVRPLRLSRPPLRPLWLPLLALKPAARTWLPSVPSELLLSSSTRPRLSSRLTKLKSVLKAKFCLSGAYAGGRPFKTRRLISGSVTSIS